MTMPPGHEQPAHPLDVEHRGQQLVITPHSDFDRAARNSDWAHQIIRSCPGPVSGITIDLQHVSMVSSSFFAGALTLLEHYRHDDFQHIVLWRVGDRIVRTVDMMHMRNAFIVRQPDTPEA